MIASTSMTKRLLLAFAALSALAPAVAAADVPNIRIDAKALQVPIVVAVPAVTFGPRAEKVFGHAVFHGTDSPARVTVQPIVTFDLAEDNLPITIAVTGFLRAWSSDSNGFYISSSTQFWGKFGGAPMLPPPGGWKRGHYNIYPNANVSETEPGHPFEVQFYNPDAPRGLSASGQHITLDKPLATPTFLQVTLQPNRRELAAKLVGNGCEHLALPSAADLVIDIERPLPGLVITALPSVQPVSAHSSFTTSADPRPRQHCTPFAPGATDAQAGGSVPRGRLTLDASTDEGRLALSFGSPDATQATAFTLMVYDASSKLEPLAPAPVSVTATFADREASVHFPQLDARVLNQHGYAALALAAQLYAAMPRDAFVYAKLDFDRALVYASTAVDGAFPVKNERLLLVDNEAHSAACSVLAADGIVFRVDKKHLVLAPSGSEVVPAAPRALDPALTASMYDAINMLPPGGKARAAYEKKMEVFDACRGKAWAPYGAQLPQVMPGFVIAEKSAGYVQVETAGDAAMDKQCGTKATFDKKIEGDRQKLLKEIAAYRATLLEQATAR